MIQGNSSSVALQRGRVVRRALPALGTGDLARVALSAGWLLLLRIPGMLRRWVQRSRQRAELAQLDDHLLRDIGLTRLQARRESATWFWRP